MEAAPQLQNQLEYWKIGTQEQKWDSKGKPMIKHTRSNLEMKENKKVWRSTYLEEER